jgi:hypothetical protein
VKQLAPLFAAVGAVTVVVGVYVALGGASYEPTRVADPCSDRVLPSPDGLQETIERIALSGLDSAACELGTPREELVLALRDETALDEYVAANGLTRDATAEAVRDGLRGAVDDAEASGALPGLVASVARGTLSRIPPWLLIEALERLGGLLT